MDTTINNRFRNGKIIIHSSYLWYLTLTYSMIIILANWFDPRLINVWGLTTDAGTLIFPLSFLLSDLITEVYGYKYARRTIWCGFVFNLFFILYGQLVIHMPNPNFTTNNALFDTLLTINSRIILASFISYLIAESFNSYLIAKTKIKTQGRYMGGRFLLATFLASGLDSIIFTAIAFYKTLPHSVFMTMMFTMWLIKLFIELCGLPLSINLVNKLKKIEQIDIYDKNTKFNLFRFDLDYIQQENEFLNNTRKEL
ncbi:TPA: queuosine precursor transporter [Legionella anisa]